MTQPTLAGGDFDLKPRRGLYTPRVALELLLAMIVNSVASGRRDAHCYSAHVPGEGYVNKGDRTDLRAEYLRQLTRDLKMECENIRYAPAYAEPGYTDPARGILFANWNLFPRNIGRILEYAGYDIEWSDEWYFCEDCNKAFRTSPDSYSWSPSYADVGECTSLCHECLADDPETLLEEITGDHTRCLSDSLRRKIDLRAAGYEPLDPDAQQFENGWHPGQDDDPQKIAKDLESRGIDPSRILFVQTEQSQFYIGFAVWLKAEDQEDQQCEP